MHKFILVEKESSINSNWPYLLRKKRIPELSVEQIINKYQGFQGDLVLTFSIFNDSINFDKIIDQYKEYQKLSNCVLLFTVSNSELIPALVKQNATKMGYDIGFLTEESIYSSIFYEVIFGNFNELIAYKDFLNENLLFEDRSLAETYVALHDKLSAQGKSVEDIVEMTIYEIWKYKD